MRAQSRAQQVVSRRSVRHPIAQRFADRVLEGTAAVRHRLDLGSQQAHAENVQALAPHVLLAHVDHAIEPEERANRGGGDAVLSGPRLCDDPLLTHAARE